MGNTKYDEITNRIIAELDKGTAPWSKPWTSRAPVNAVNGKAYRGINTLLLGMAGHADHRWLTFKQALDLGGNVTKGQRGTSIVFWQFKTEGDDETKVERRIPLVRVYTVFNAAQCEKLLVSQGGKLADLEPISTLGDGSAIEAARLLLANMPDAPGLKQSIIAAYVPAKDEVLMPDHRTFQTETSYTATLAHELAHSTGHSKRLNRAAVVGTIMFGSEDYSEEELVAELGACFVCSEIGVANDVQNSAAYIEAWRQKLSKDSKLIIRAASQAQKAADCVLGRAAA